MSGFGFQVPTGDPAALEAASRSWRTLGLALIEQGETLAAAADIALGAGGWQGPASTAFAGTAERLIGGFRADAGACAQASGALSTLARALEQAQQATRQALGTCEQSQTELSTQQQAAAQAGQEASGAQQAAAGTINPMAAQALMRVADAAGQRQSAAQQAAGQAQGALTAAERQGRQAMLTYEREAQAVVAQLRAAAAELQPAPADAHGWADAVVSWLGHANDFAGAGAVGLIKGYEAAIALAAKQLVQETEAFLEDPEAALAGLDGVDPRFQTAVNAGELADSPFTKILTAGLPEDTFGVLGKVPYLAWALTAVDMFMNRNQGLGTGVVEPLGNLAVGTVITEASSAAVAPVIEGAAGTLAAGDGVVAALAGTAFVPGVGEVVIVGALAVGGTYLVDKGAEWVWDNRGEIGHDVVSVAKGAWHGIETGVNWVANEGTTAVNTARHVVHDLEPWNW